MKMWVLILAIIFWWHQNRYFGWNGMPKSDAELIADGLTFVLVAMAVR